MALYAIGDLHLSLGTDKPMDVFGGVWKNYLQKLERGLSCIGPADTTVLLGDISWAMNLEAAAADFAYLASIPGRKIILKGNHDYWWVTAAKFQRFCQEHGFADLYLLNNNAYFYGEIALCGTRGWFFEEERHGGQHDAKILNRELMRLEASLQAAGERGEVLLPALSAPLPGLYLPGDPGAAGKIPGHPVLLRPSAWRQPQAGHRGHGKWHRFSPGFRGFY